MEEEASANGSRGQKCRSIRKCARERQQIPGELQDTKDYSEARKATRKGSGGTEDGSHPRSNEAIRVGYINELNRIYTTRQRQYSLTYVGLYCCPSPFIISRRIVRMSNHHFDLSILKGNLKVATKYVYYLYGFLCPLIIVHWKKMGRKKRKLLR